MMKPPKQLLLTFDYELFLGKKSGSVDNCLIRPTDFLIDIFKKYQICHAVFFVDTTYLWRLNELSEVNALAKDDWNKIKNQLQDIIQAGHYVFPHIHPHWLDAIYLPEQNQWDLSNIRKYRFHHLAEEERAEVFQKSFYILKKIIFPVSSYCIDSFRAGGWCIQPFVDFKSFFQQYDIKNDFSVLPMMKKFSTVQYYDFTNIREKNIYRFEDEVSVEQEDGNFAEYAVSTISVPLRVKLLNRIWLKCLWKTNNKSIGDGLGAEPVSLTADSSFTQVKNQNRDYASIELLNAVTLSFFLSYLKQNIYLHFLSHPKMLSMHNIHTFEKFCKIIFSKYNVETDFRKIKL